MKKTSRILALVCALLMMFSVLTGCGSSESASTETTTTAKQADTSETTEVADDKPYAGRTIHILMEDVPDTGYVQELIHQF